MKIDNIISIILLLILFIASVYIFFGNKNTSEKEVIKFQTDTLYVRDTVFIKIKEPVEKKIVRTDTIFKLINDTFLIPVEIPIEQKIYQDSNYKAVIEGYKPELISLELYPLNKIITNTITSTIYKKKKFSIGIQAGYGYSDKFRPYIGVGLGYNLFSW